MLTGLCENAGALADLVDDARGQGLFVFGLDGYRLEIFGFEDLAAVEALDVIDTIAAGYDRCSFVLTGGLHRDAGDTIILMILHAVSRGEDHYF